MRFARPEMLWLLAALPLLALAAWVATARRRRALTRFAGAAARRLVGDQINPHLRAGKWLLLGAGIVLATLALARPQWGTAVEEVQRSGADVAIVLDRSLSMAAEDVAPSRFDLARHRIRRLLDDLEGDRIALVEFSGTAGLACPLTLDRGAIRLFLETLDVESVAVPGTSLAEALKSAAAALDPGEEGAAGPTRSRAIVLFTDGEDHEGGIEPVVERLTRDGIAVYAVGCGTLRGGPIPLDDTGGGGYKTDAEGKIVTTRLDEAFLEGLARSTEGQYHRATPRGEELERIASALGDLDRRAFDAALRVRYEERYQWPLLLGLFALASETALGDRRRRRRGKGGPS